MVSNKTKPIFILGSGRCGTFQISKIFDEYENASAHHEFLFDNILESCVLYKMERISKSDVKNLILSTHMAEVNLTNDDVWIDSSNALPWIADVLLEIFPDAKFVHLIRDGRKVVSSFFNKFQTVMYHEDYVKKQKNWLDNPHNAIKPPPYKNYWRPLPGYGKNFLNAFPKDRFEHLCWYWGEINLHIDNFKDSVNQNNYLEIKLENLVNDINYFESFINFMDLEYKPELFKKIERPLNVAEPKNYILSLEEKIKYDNICGEVAQKFGYHDKDEYAVKY